MKARIERNLRSAFGVILALGIVALPQASRAQVRVVSGHPIGVRVLASPAGDVYAAASVGDLSLLRLRTWMKLADLTFMSGSVSVPPDVRPLKIRITTSTPDDPPDANRQ